MARHRRSHKKAFKAGMRKGKRMGTRGIMSRAKRVMRLGNRR